MKGDRFIRFMKNISNESLEEDTDPKMVDREIAGEADGYYVIL